MAEEINVETQEENEAPETEEPKSVEVKEELNTEALQELLANAIAPLQEKIEALESGNKTEEEPTAKEYGSLDEFKEDMLNELTKVFEEKRKKQEETQAEENARINKEFDMQIQAVKDLGHEIDNETQAKVFQHMVDKKITSFVSAFADWNKSNNKTNKEKASRISGNKGDTPTPVRKAKPGETVLEAAQRALESLTDE